MSTVSIDNVLPEEVLVKVFQQLNYKEKSNSLQVCRLWNRLVAAGDTRQRPVSLFIAEDDGTFLKDCFFPKFGFIHGVDECKNWEKVFLQNVDQAAAFLTNFCRGTKVGLTSSSTSKLLNCLAIVKQNWANIEEVYIEHLACDTLGALSPLCDSSYASLVTSLTLGLSNRTSLETLTFLRCFRNLKTIRILEGSLVLNVNHINDLPQTLERFWFRGSVIIPSLSGSVNETFKTLIDRYGKQLKELSTTVLCGEDIRLLCQRCPNLEALNICTSITTSPELLLTSLGSLKKLEHLFLRAALDREQEEEEDVDENEDCAIQIADQQVVKGRLSCLTRAWPKLKSLDLYYWTSTSTVMPNTYNIMKVALQSCPSLDTIFLHIANDFGDNKEKQLLKLTKLTELNARICSLALRLTEDGLCIFEKLLPCFGRVRNFDIWLVALFTTGRLVQKLEPLLVSVARQNPSESVYVTWIGIKGERGALYPEQDGVVRNLFYQFKHF